MKRVENAPQILTYRYLKARKDRPVRGSARATEVMQSIDRWPDTSRNKSAIMELIRDRRNLWLDVSRLLRTAGNISTTADFKYWRTAYTDLCIVASYREWNNVRWRSAGTIFCSIVFLALSVLLIITLGSNGAHLYIPPTPIPAAPLPDQPSEAQLAWVGVAATVFAGIAGWRALAANGLVTVRLIGVTCLTLIIAAVLQVTASLLGGPDVFFRVQLLQAAAAVFLVQALILTCAALIYWFGADLLERSPQENLMIRCFQFAGLSRILFDDRPTEIPDIQQRKVLLAVAEDLKSCLLQATVGKLGITDPEISRVSLGAARGPLQRLSELQLMIALPDRQRRTIVRSDAMAFLAAAVTGDLRRCPEPATVPTVPTRSRLLGGAAVTLVVALLPAALLLVMLEVSDKLPSPVITAAFVLCLVWLVVILAQLSASGAPAVLKQVATVFGLMKSIAEPKKQDDSPAPS